MSANRDAVGLAAAELETPALCLDIEKYRRNVARMVEFIVKRHGVAWRPHMKGQKARELAREAVAAGAIGVTCATLYEAEAMVRSGVGEVLIAHEIVGARKQARLARLAREAPGLIACTDSVEHAGLLNAAALAENAIVPVLIEIDGGMRRCGIAPGEPVVALARAIGDMPGLRLRGLMAWEGHVLSFDPETKRKKIEESIGALRSSAELCRAAGIDVEILSASGSGTFRMSVDLPGITEVQAGGGVFSDLSYEKWGLDHEFALTVMTRVVSVSSPVRVIVDGGFKSMSVQHGLPRPLGVGAVKSLSLSAEHGTIELEEPKSLRVGDAISFVPGYTDSTVCLHDEMCVIRGGVVEAVWAIPGRTGRR